MRKFLGKYLDEFLSCFFKKDIILPHIYVKNIQLNSKLVTKGDLFVALKGSRYNGRNYICEAVFNGAVAILTYSNSCESYYFFNYEQKIFYFYLVKLSFYLSKICGDFYDNPSKNIILVSVTGTNGKTTVVKFLSQWIYLLGYKSAMLSTIGNGIYPNLSKSENTTSSALYNQCQLKLYSDSGVNFVSVEVSSHALIQYRVQALLFKAAVFTNLSLDHLDYHLNFYNYQKAKWKLFSEFNIKNLIINIDDVIGFQWSKILLKDFVIAVSYKNINISNYYHRWIYIKKIKNYGSLKKIYFCSSWGHGIIKTFLLGFFNVKNLLLSFATLLSLKYNISHLLATSKYITLPVGRMELIYVSAQKPLVIIDYAHTPDAFQSILLEAKIFCKGKLWCIFGCTGNRDKSKRSIMGKIVQYLADVIIITNDDPYCENEDVIISDIKSGIDNFNNVYTIKNRFLAIKFGVDNCSSNDLLLILGKGHENYQFFCNKKVLFSDKNLILKLLKKG